MGALYYSGQAANPMPLAYLASRGLDLATIERHRLGYASGEELTDFLLAAPQLSIWLRSRSIG